MGYLQVVGGGKIRGVSVGRTTLPRSAIRVTRTSPSKVLLIVRTNTNGHNGGSAPRHHTRIRRSLGETLRTNCTLLRRKTPTRSTIYTTVHIVRSTPRFGTNHNTTLADRNVMSVSSYLVANVSNRINSTYNLAASGGPVGMTHTVGRGAGRIVFTGPNGSLLGR